MNDRVLKTALRISVLFLILAVVFCIMAVVNTNGQREEMEQQRLETETQLAQMQMETVPMSENVQEDVQEDVQESVQEDEEETEAVMTTTVKHSSKIIVLDPGHGKSSSLMSAEEKEAEGYEYNQSRGGWGEWRHYKNGTFGEDCNGSGCTERCPSNGSCWYPIGNGDRETEPGLNLNNAFAAKKYLEQMGYEVRMTRTSNDENPSMDRRVSYCFPDNDITAEPDASAYICIHANAGGGRGSAYIALSDPYTQSFISDSYVEDSNNLGNIINNKVVAATGLKQLSALNQPYLILFNKCPVPIAYMEMGFYDSSADLAIIQSSSDEIGRAIAEGIDEYFANN